MTHNGIVNDTTALNNAGWSIEIELLNASSVRLNSSDHKIKLINAQKMVQDVPASLVIASGATATAEQQFLIDNKVASINNVNGFLKLTFANDASMDNIQNILENIRYEYAGAAIYSSDVIMKYTIKDNNNKIHSGSQTTIKPLTGAGNATNNDDIFFATTAADVIDGLGGNDIIYYSSSTAGGDVNLTRATQQNGYAQGDQLTNIENVVGSQYNDIFVGNTLNNILEGAGGADKIDGEGGNDTVSYIQSNAGVTIDLTATANASGYIVTSGGHAQGDELKNIEHITGSNYQDVLTGDGNANHIKALAGNDTINGGAGADVINGGAGNDTIDGGTGNDTIDGGDGNDTITGGAGADIINGGAGDDVITYDSADTGKIDGGSGSDTLSNISASVSSTITVSNGSSNTGFVNFEVIRLGNHGDTLTTSNLTTSITVHGGTGNDTINGGTGDDILNGGDGNDTLKGGAGNDTINGGAGNDTIIYDSADNNIDGGTGNDILDNSASNVKNTITLSANGASSGIRNFQTIRLGGAGDLLNASVVTTAMVIVGGAGADTITGGTANDQIDAGAGNDIIIYDTNDTTQDAIDGGLDNDTINASSSTTAVTINLASSSDAYKNFENIIGSTSVDTLTGDANDNIINGGGGYDTINAGGGNDTVIFDVAFNTGQALAGAQVGKIDGGSGY